MVRAGSLGFAYPETVEKATENIIGAVSVAEQLPEPLSSELLVSSGQAFISGLNAAALLSTVIFISLALASIGLLRQVRPSEDIVK